MCVCVCVCVRVHACAQLCSLFVVPQTAAYQAPLSMRFVRQEYSSGLPFPTPGDFPTPGVEPVSHVSSALAADSLPLARPGNHSSSNLCSKFVKPSDIFKTLRTRPDYQKIS